VVSTQSTTRYKGKLFFFFFFFLLAVKHKGEARCCQLQEALDTGENGYKKEEENQRG
jgi:hypothetical protein